MDDDEIRDEELVDGDMPIKPNKNIGPLADDEVDEIGEGDDEEDVEEDEY